MIYTVENTWKELHEARVTTAIVPFGAVEQHGHHLPLGTDWLIADQMGRALAEALGEDVLLLPAMPFGNSREHMAFPGTITLRPATLAAVLEDIVESLRHHGIRTVIVFSAHGGNWILKPALRARRNNEESIEEFAANLGEAFSEVHRVLKRQGLLAFTFRHSTPQGWLAMAKALARSGLKPVQVLPMPGEAGTGLHTHDGTSLWDAVLVFRKLPTTAPSQKLSKQQVDAARANARRWHRPRAHRSRGLWCQGPAPRSAGAQWWPRATPVSAPAARIPRSGGSCGFPAAGS